MTGLAPIYFWANPVFKNSSEDISFTHSHIMANPQEKSRHK
jgi:hypothetical protein